MMRTFHERQVLFPALSPSLLAVGLFTYARSQVSERPTMAEVVNKLEVMERPETEKHHKKKKKKAVRETGQR